MLWWGTLGPDLKSLSPTEALLSDGTPLLADVITAGVYCQFALSGITAMCSIIFEQVFSASNDIVYSWGRGIRGLHGQGHTEDLQYPTEIKELSGIPMAEIASGHCASAATSV